MDITDNIENGEKTRVFLSYTLRDASLNRSKLKKFRKSVENSSGYSLYIDIIDNQTEVNNFQDKVIQQLDEADVFWYINSKQYNSSPWTNEELKRARELHKPMFYIELNDVYSQMNSKTFNLSLKECQPALT